MQSPVLLVKKGIHAGESVPFLPSHLLADHSFGLEKQAAAKRSDSLLRERRRVLGERHDATRRNLGTVGDLRQRENDWQADQEKAASTSVVELYQKGMGLRVERRQDGYSWKGASRRQMTIAGEDEDRSLVVAGQGGGKRGVCKGATAASMARFRDKVYKVSREAVPVFVTLGWPRSQFPTPENAKECLHHFLITLIRRYPRASGFWKFEFGDVGGLPHYHLLLWGARPWKRWLSRTWFKICATGNPDHLAAGTRIEKLRSYRGTLSYTGKKYMAKAGSYPPGNWGRVWGCFNKAAIPWDEPIRVECPAKCGLWFARIQRRFMRAKYGKKKGGRGRVLWVNPDHAAQWLRVLEWAETLPDKVLQKREPIPIPLVFVGHKETICGRERYWREEVPVW